MFHYNIYNKTFQITGIAKIIPSSRQGAFSSKRFAISLFHHKNICCGHSLEVPHCDTSNEYPQHIFSWKNKKKLSGYRLLSGVILSYLEVCVLL